MLNNETKIDILELMVELYSHPLTEGEYDTYGYYMYWSDNDDVLCDIIISYFKGKGVKVEKPMDLISDYIDPIRLNFERNYQIELPEFTVPETKEFLDVSKQNRVKFLNYLTFTLDTIKDLNL